MRKMEMGSALAWPVTFRYKKSFIPLVVDGEARSMILPGAALDLLEIRSFQPS
jgi:hypothetical protein